MLNIDRPSLFNTDFYSGKKIAQAYVNKPTNMQAYTSDTLTKSIPSPLLGKKYQYTDQPQSLLFILTNVHGKNQFKTNLPHPPHPPTITANNKRDTYPPIYAIYVPTATRSTWEKTNRAGLAWREAKQKGANT